MRRRAIIACLVALFSTVAGSHGSQPATHESRLRATLGLFASHAFPAGLKHDPALADAARQHSEVLATETRIDTHEFLRQALSQLGVLDPFPYVFYGSGPESRFEEIETRLRTQLLQLPEVERRLYTHFGVGVQVVKRRGLFFRTRHEFYVTVLLTQRAVSFAPLPGHVSPGDCFVFEGELHPPFSQPEILLTQPDGDTRVLDNFLSDPCAFRTYVRLGEMSGEYQLEVMGRYNMGPRVLALCSLFPRAANEPLQYERVLQAARDGTLQPSQTPPPVRQKTTERDAEQVLLQLVNRDRAGVGLPALLESSQLAELARSHSADMRDGGFFAHVSPHTGRLRDRAEAAHVRYLRLGENIAVGADVQEAQRALMRSPGHRMNLLDPDFSHVGVGVVFETDKNGNQRVYVTQNFMIPDLN